MLSLKNKILFSLIIAITFLSLTLIVMAPKNNFPPLKFNNSFSPQDIASPSDWVKEEQIKVYPNQIILNVKDATWATFTPTGSMKPILDEKTNALEIKPSSPNDIKLGDIIAYESPEGIIIHRVIEKNIDENGIYFLVKGDNNFSQDPTKIRFENIKGVVIAIIY